MNIIYKIRKKVKFNAIFLFIQYLLFVLLFILKRFNVEDIKSMLETFF